MKPQFKSALLLAVVMLLGVLLGILIGTRIINNRIDKMRDNLLEGKLLITTIEEAANPSETQKKEIEVIVEEYKPKFRELFIASRSEARALIDSLTNDLNYVLTEEQLDDLKQSKIFRQNKLNDRLLP